MSTTRPIEPAAAPPAGRWQFRLSHLFILTTLASFAAALVAAVGPGTLMTSTGIVLAWMNWCGAFERWQTGRRKALLLGTAWGLFLLSLLLPCMDPYSPIYGWQAAWIVLTGPYEALIRGDFLQPEMAWFLAMDTANILAVLLPLLIWRLSRGGGQWYGAALCVTMVSVWVLIFWDSEMLVGYYLWCGSFLLMLAALPVPRGTLAAMVVAAAVFPWLVGD